MRLEGRALHVGVEIWFRAGLRCRGDVALSLSKVASTGGFDRATAARGLAALERVGLVRVERGVGRAPRVTLLETDPAGEEEAPESSSRQRHIRTWATK
jgi:DNA-binding transcriptional regulator YhcF (GntR family)